jgi:hypothetical protein
VILHQDGKIFAELDVLQPHPTKTKFYVEGVNAWGSLNNLRAELKLLENPA